ncbi:Endonuclease/exonuclease/phosphatase [Phellopilus nigrolimitatus]|nr:Endonuclease/exonuclease/phosphatase [Phellopilus nigrolimitatus]
MGSAAICPVLNLTDQPAAMLSSLFLAVCVSLVSPVSVSDIQGPAFLSPFAGKTVSNVSGLVTAKGPSGFWIAGNRSNDVRVSNGLYVYSTSEDVLDQVATGDIISLGGKVSEFHSSSSYLYTTELVNPIDIDVISSNNTITPLVLGQNRCPPTQQLSELDVGSDGFLSVPNNQSSVSAKNASLHPDLYGLDFWESLEGQLVTVTDPTVANFENHYGDFWVYGDWNVTGKNARGGVTMTYGPDGTPDANPEVLIVGSPLDGTDNPSVAIGQKLEDITGVIVQQHGYFNLVPTTAPIVLSSPDFDVPPTTIESSDTDACVITVGDYNVENLAPTSSHLTKIADHIATWLKSPDIVFLQEIQDNSGPANDGTVDANVTLTTLVNAIANASGGVLYSFSEIAPVDGEDGGQPGGNIRVAYLYRADKVRLTGNATAGGPLDTAAIHVDGSGKSDLTFNPGRIDPKNKSHLVAVWESALPSSSGNRFFTINLHMSSKNHPVNHGVDQRTSQVNTVSTFVKSILKEDEQANIIAGGDCNEFLMARSVFKGFDGFLADADEIAGVPDVERYTYVFAQNNEQLDHIFVSDAIKARGVSVEHIHINNWAANVDERGSDHDPSVAKVAIC